MKKRVASGPVPSTNDSARRRSSTTSSATSRWPRPTSSSAHSLLPMPLSPTISTPRPSRSMSTPWTSMRSASSPRAARSACAIAVPVGVDVPSSGTPARSHASTSSASGREPGRDEDRREVWCAEQACGSSRRSLGARLSRNRISLSPKHQDAARPEVLVEAGQREAGLLEMRAGDRRDRAPVRPATTSSVEVRRHRARAGARRRRRRRAEYDMGRAPAQRLRLDEVELAGLPREAGR